MRGRRPEADHRFTFTPHISRVLGAGREQSDAWPSFAAVERSMSDRLLMDAEGFTAHSRVSSPSSVGYTVSSVWNLTW